MSTIIARAVLADRRRSAGRAHLRLIDWLELFRQRRSLARLDDAALDDLGLTRDEAQHEASRPVWDVPAHWLK